MPNWPITVGMSLSGSNRLIGFLDHDEDARKRKEADQGRNELDAAQKAVSENVTIDAIDRVGSDHADCQSKEQADQALEHRFARKGRDQAQAKYRDGEIFDGAELKAIAAIHVAVKIKRIVLVVDANAALKIDSVSASAASPLSRIG